MRLKPLLAIVVGAATVGLVVTAAAGDTTETDLGRLLYFDETLSARENQACASCHHPSAGFADPRNAADPERLPVSPGSLPGRFGGRNAPSAAYARFTPTFHWDEGEGLYVGGQFWDGRAHTLAKQAAGPPLNPVEMALPDKQAAVEKLVRNPDYVQAFDDLYDIDLNEAVTSPSGTLAAYDRMATAMGAFEKTRKFAGFSSRFDYWLAGKYTMTPEEEQGLKLFTGKAHCSLCHAAEAGVAPDGGVLPPFLTDFTYDNVGLPVNPRIAELAGPQPVDYGLGARPDVAAVDPVTLPDGTVVSLSQAGKFKVVTLRNVQRTAPYGHNGFFPTLASIVHFYNTRDVLPDCALLPDPEVGVNCWPAPEVHLNVNHTELGHLNLTPDQEAAVVAFLGMLTDGYGPPTDVALPPSP